MPVSQKNCFGDNWNSDLALFLKPSRHRQGSEECLQLFLCFAVIITGCGISLLLLL